MKSQEIIDVVDDQGQVIDTISREEAELNNRTIQNVIVFVFNSVSKVWIQKRPMNKNHFPGLWDASACGAVHAGEQPLDAAWREQLEEMGFNSELLFIETFLNRFTGDDGRPTQRLSHLFISLSNEIPITNEEVEEFLSIQHAELREWVVEKPTEYIPSFLVELDKAITAFEEVAKDIVREEGPITSQ